MEKLMFNHWCMQQMQNMNGMMQMPCMNQVQPQTLMPWHPNGLGSSSQTKVPQPHVLAIDEPAQEKAPLLKGHEEEGGGNEDRDATVASDIPNSAPC